jgi:hypothetical protein
MQWSEKRMTAKERIREILEMQPDDASFDAILRELAFERAIAASRTHATGVSFPMVR